MAANIEPKAGKRKVFYPQIGLKEELHQIRKIQVGIGNNKVKYLRLKNIDPHAYQMLGSGFLQIVFNSPIATESTDEFPLKSMKMTFYFAEYARVD